MLHRTLLRQCRPATTAGRGRPHVTLPHFTALERGTAGTKDWRFFLSNPETNALVSAWHDLPRRPGIAVDAASADPRLCVAVTEIARGTRAKMELCKEEPHNPIKQDVFAKQSGQPLRFFAYGAMPFNYGFLPRTWEDPTHTDPRTGCVGDGDPIDVVHLGPTHVLGQCEVVRVLGVLGLIDVGETDWKIIVEPATGDGYGHLSKVPQDVKAVIVDWFENYKVPDGKPKNEFAFHGEIQDAETALEVMAQCAAQYDALVAGTKPDHGYWLR
jgi:inorganic pyrophosphatase